MSAGLIVGQQVCASEFETSLRVIARLRKDAPGFETAGHRKQIFGPRRLPLNQRGFECFHGGVCLSLSRTDERNLFHPLRVVEVQLIQLGVRSRSVIEAKQTLLQTRTGRVEIDSIRPDRLGSRVSADGCREILKVRLDACFDQGPAEIARRIVRGLVVIRSQLLRAAMTVRITGRFPGELFILRIAVQNFDVLIDRAGIIFQTCEDGDQSTTHGSGFFDLVSRGQLGRPNGVQSCGVEIP